MNVGIHCAAQHPPRRRTVLVPQAQFQLFRHQPRPLESKVPHWQEISPGGLSAGCSLRARPPAAAPHRSAITGLSSLVRSAEVWSSGGNEKGIKRHGAAGNLRRFFVHRAIWLCEKRRALLVTNWFGVSQTPVPCHVSIVTGGSHADVTRAGLRCGGLTPGTGGMNRPIVSVGVVRASKSGHDGSAGKP